MKLPIETKSRAQPPARHGKWYDDACGTALAMELLGERWALLIVRELMFGGRRFSELRADLPGISAKVLSERLDSLERAGVLGRVRLASPHNAWVYALTEWGHAADEAIMALGRWAARSPAHDQTLPLSPASLGLSLRTMFDPARAGTARLAGNLRIGHQTFRAAVRDRVLTVERGEEPAPDFTLSAPGAAIVAALIHGKVPALELSPAGLVITGCEEDALRFADCFAMPPKADMPPHRAAGLASGAAPR